jgi:valyl-tRNA synthetase
MGIPPSREIRLVMHLSDNRSEDGIRRFEGYLQRLARVTALAFVSAADRPRHAASAVVQGEELFIPLEGLIDLDIERARLRKEIDRLDLLTGQIRAKLGNAGFVERAPKDVVEREREKLGSMETNLAKLRRNLDSLS